MRISLASLSCPSAYGRRAQVRSSAASNITSILPRVRGAVDERHAIWERGRGLCSFVTEFDTTTGLTGLLNTTEASPLFKGAQMAESYRHQV